MFTRPSPPNGMIGCSVLMDNYNFHSHLPFRESSEQIVADGWLPSRPTDQL